MDSESRQGRSPLLLTRIAMFVAVGIVLGLTLSAIPNVELVTAVCFVAGFLLGPSAGVLVGGLTEALFAGFHPMGSSFGVLLASQVVGMALAGALGGLAAWLVGHRYATRALSVDGRLHRRARDLSVRRPDKPGLPADGRVFCFHADDFAGGGDSVFGHSHRVECPCFFIDRDTVASPARKSVGPTVKRYLQLLAVLLGAATFAMAQGPVLRQSDTWTFSYEDISDFMRLYPGVYPLDYGTIGRADGVPAVADESVDAGGDARRDSAEPPL